MTAEQNFGVSHCGGATAELINEGDSNGRRRWGSDIHHIRIQVKRKDVEVRYRRGYMAFPEAPLLG